MGVKRRGNMIVKDLIKRLKKMPQTKEVYFLITITRDYIVWMREFGIYQTKKINLKLM